MRTPVCLAAFLPLFVAGCGSVVPTDAEPSPAPAAARYPVRTDPLVVPNASLGSPTRWPSPGFPPLRSLRLASTTPDPDIAAQLRDAVGKKSILDPATGLPDAIRDEIGRLLDLYFGTPAAPRVKVPGPTEVAALWPPAGSDWDPPEIKAYNAKKARALTESGAAPAAVERLGLTTDALARGGVLYRRWCVQCHGTAGGGDGANAVAAAAPPRDYRSGLFKFTTASPNTGSPGEKGKPRRDDLRRTVRHGLDGSMMPPFPTFSDADLDDLVGYVTHLSVRGETELRVMARAIAPKGNDDELKVDEVQREFASAAANVLADWERAAAAPIVIPPENTPTEADRLESARRGYKLFHGGGCAGCHVNYGREPALRYDAWGTVVQPRNLALGVYRGGRRGDDLYARIYGGVYPSGMNEHKELLAKNPSPPGKPDAIWDVVHFLQSLADAPRRRALADLDPTVKIDP